MVHTDTFSMSVNSQQVF